MVFRLEELCGIQIAIELANKLEFKKEILRLSDLDRSMWYDGSEPWFENIEKKVLDILEKLPFGLRRKIPIPVVIFCLTQSIEWAKFYKKEFDLPFDYSCSFLKSSLFTSKGIFDEEKAAREILKDIELSPSLKFCIACYYCLSDVIPVLWEQLPEDKRPKIENKIFKNGFSIGGRNEMADLWSYFLLGEFEIIMDGRNDSFSLYKFKKTFDNESYRNCSDVAFKKCFEELNEREKEEAVIFSRDKLRYLICDVESFGRHKSNYLSPQLLLPFQKNLEIVIFLLHHLDERKLKVFFQPVLLFYVLFHSLSWPYEHMFMDIVSQFWEVLPKTGFCLLLHWIVILIKNKSSSKLCNYHNILRDFWIQSSPSLKRFFFRLEGINKRDMHGLFIYEEREYYFISELYPDFEHFHDSYVICELFDSPFTIEDEKVIRLIFSSATMEEKSDIIRLQGDRIGKISFKACDLRRIDLFIECCVPKGRIESFKKELFNDKEVKKVLFYLVLDNKGKEFQKILNWAFSAEEIKEWLKNFLLCVRQDWKYTLYYCKKIKCFDESLKWALSSNEIANFKKSLVSDKDFTGHLKYSLFKGDFQDLDFFLEWIFSSEMEMVKFKKDLTFIIVRHIDQSLLINGLISLKKLIEWSALSEEEGKDFRRQVAFSEKVIEYYSNLVAKRQLYEVDAFIRWAELTQTEVKNFKKLLVFKVEENTFSPSVSSMFNNEGALVNVEGNIFSPCVSFILNGNRDFVQKLVSWTQFSKEEIREFYSLVIDELNLYSHIVEKNTKLNDIKEFFNGFPLSKNEIKRHKKDLLYESLNLIEYFVMENRWDEMEELLGWCFSSKTEMSDFKKKIPLKINNICLNLILSQRYDDVDKFFTWTGVHNSLKNRFLKEAIFDSRVYQIVLEGMYDIINRKIEGLFNFLSSNDLFSNKWKESFLIWLYKYKDRSNCPDVNCFKIASPDYRGFSVQLHNHHRCDDCESFIEDCEHFLILFEEYKYTFKIRPKRKLESFLQINSPKRKKVDIADIFKLPFSL